MIAFSFLYSLFQERWPLRYEQPATDRLPPHSRGEHSHQWQWEHSHQSGQFLQGHLLQQQTDSCERARLHSLPGHVLTVEWPTALWLHLQGPCHLPQLTAQVRLSRPHQQRTQLREGTTRAIRTEEQCPALLPEQHWKCPFWH